MKAQNSPSCKQASSWKWQQSWWRHQNGDIFRVTGPLCGEFTGPGEFPTQRPVTRSFDVSFDLRLNKRLSKQPWGWWLETLSWSLWRQCNDHVPTTLAVYTQAVKHMYTGNMYIAYCPIHMPRLQWLILPCHFIPSIALIKNHSGIFMQCKVLQCDI